MTTGIILWSFSVLLLIRLKRHRLSMIDRLDALGLNKREIMSMTKKTYHAKPGAPFTEQDAQKVGEYLETLGEEITPHQLLALAKVKSNPLHKLFEWDNDAAARKYRLQQARLIINRIEVDIELEEGSVRERAFVNLSVMKSDEDKKNNRGRRYIPIAKVLSDEGMTERYRAQLRRDLELMKARYESFDHVFDAAFAALN